MLHSHRCGGARRGSILPQWAQNHGVGMSQAIDYQNMADALDLAKSQAGKTGKNPSVGCVIVAADGTRLATGVTGKGGAPHAEEAALRDLSPDTVRGATAYVTLEPCRERSAGGLSCSERLLNAGIARLVCPIAAPPLRCRRFCPPCQGRYTSRYRPYAR